MFLAKLRHDMGDLFIGAGSYLPKTVNKIDFLFVQSGFSGNGKQSYTHRRRNVKYISIMF